MAPVAPTTWLPHAEPGTVVAVITFVCKRVQVAGSPIGPAGVCEVVALRLDGSFQLLRTATDAPELQQALVRAGLPAVLLTKVSVSTGPGVHEARCDIAKDSATETTAAAATASTTGVEHLDGDGLQHHYEDGKGRTVTTTYENTLSGRTGRAGDGPGVLDARQDPQLATWLGTPLAGAAVVAVRGDWTATVSRRG